MAHPSHPAFFIEREVRRYRPVRRSTEVKWTDMTSSLYGPSTAGTLSTIQQRWVLFTMMTLLQFGFLGITVAAMIIDCSSTGNSSSAPIFVVASGTDYLVTSTSQCPNGTLSVQLSESTKASGVWSNSRIEVSGPGVTFLPHLNFDNAGVAVLNVTVVFRDLKTTSASASIVGTTGPTGVVLAFWFKSLTAVTILFDSVEFAFTEPWDAPGLMPPLLSTSDQLTSVSTLNITVANCRIAAAMLAPMFTVVSSSLGLAQLVTFQLLRSTLWLTKADEEYGVVFRFGHGSTPVSMRYTTIVIQESNVTVQTCFIPPPQLFIATKRCVPHSNTGKVFAFLWIASNKVASIASSTISVTSSYMKTFFPLGNDSIYDVESVVLRLDGGSSAAGVSRVNLTDFTATLKNSTVLLQGSYRLTVFALEHFYYMRQCRFYVLDSTAQFIGRGWLTSNSSVRMAEYVHLLTVWRAEQFDAYYDNATMWMHLLSGFTTAQGLTLAGSAISNLHTACGQFLFLDANVTNFAIAFRRVTVHGDVRNGTFPPNTFQSPFYIFACSISAALFVTDTTSTLDSGTFTATEANVVSALGTYLTDVKNPGLVASITALGLTRSNVMNSNVTIRNCSLSVQTVDFQPLDDPSTTCPFILSRMTRRNLTALWISVSEGTIFSSCGGGTSSDSVSMDAMHIAVYNSTIDDVFAQERRDNAAAVVFVPATFQNGSIVIVDSGATTTGSTGSDNLRRTKLHGIATLGCSFVLSTFTILRPVGWSQLLSSHMNPTYLINSTMHVTGWTDAAPPHDLSSDETARNPFIITNRSASGAAAYYPSLISGDESIYAIISGLYVSGLVLTLDHVALGTGMTLSPSRTQSTTWWYPNAVGPDGSVLTNVSGSTLTVTCATVGNTYVRNTSHLAALLNVPTTNGAVVPQFSCSDPRWMAIPNRTSSPVHQSTDALDAMATATNAVSSAVVGGAAAGVAVGVPMALGVASLLQRSLTVLHLSASLAGCDDATPGGSGSSSNAEGGGGDGSSSTDNAVGSAVADNPLQIQLEGRLSLAGGTVVGNVALLIGAPVLLGLFGSLRRAAARWAAGDGFHVTLVPDAWLRDACAGAVAVYATLVQPTVAAGVELLVDRDGGAGAMALGLLGAAAGVVPLVVCGVALLRDFPLLGKWRRHNVSSEGALAASAESAAKAVFFPRWEWRLPTRHRLKSESEYQRCRAVAAYGAALLEPYCLHYQGTFLVELGVAIVQGLITGVTPVVTAAGGCDAKRALLWALFGLSAATAVFFVAARPFSLHIDTVCGVILNAWGGAVAVVGLYGTDAQAAEWALGQAITSIALLLVPTVLFGLELLGVIEVRSLSSAMFRVDKRWVTAMRRDNEAAKKAVSRVGSIRSIRDDRASEGAVSVNDEMSCIGSLDGEKKYMSRAGGARNPLLLVTADQRSSSHNGFAEATAAVRAVLDAAEALLRAKRDKAAQHRLQSLRVADIRSDTTAGDYYRYYLEDEGDGCDDEDPRRCLSTNGDDNSFDSLTSRDPHHRHLIIACRLEVLIRLTPTTRYRQQ